MQTQITYNYVSLPHPRTHTSIKSRTPRDTNASKAPYALTSCLRKVLKSDLKQLLLPLLTIF